MNHAYLVELLLAVTSGAVMRRAGARVSSQCFFVDLHGLETNRTSAGAKAQAWPAPATQPPGPRRMAGRIPNGPRYDNPGINAKSNSPDLPRLARSVTSIGRLVNAFQELLFIHCAVEPEAHNWGRVAIRRKFRFSVDKVSRHPFISLHGRDSVINDLSSYYPAA